MSDESSNHRGATGSRTRRSSAHRLSSRLLHVIRSAWRPTPVPRPSISLDLERLAPIERVAEVLRFDALLAERSLSPRGGLRAWVRLNVLTALVIALPALVVVPIVTCLLGGFVTWSELLARIAVNLLIAATAALGAVLVVLLIWKVIWGKRFD